VSDKLRVLALAAAAAAWSGAHAADVRPFLKAGLDFGGNTVVDVVFTDGSRDSIRANEGFYFGGGASIINAANTIEVELSVAYKMAAVTGDNGDVDFGRIPLEALVFYRLEKLRLGGGLTYHVDPKLDGSGVLSSVNVDFDNALGLVLQGDYRFGEHFTLGLRYTGIKYEASAPFSGSVKGNGIGVTAGYRF
jgi:hypothetical protein